MKVRCPNNPEHKKFRTSAVVRQDWIVDEDGEFMAEVKSCDEVIHWPDSANVWICAECGSDAVFEGGP